MKKANLFDGIVLIFFGLIVVIMAIGGLRPNTKSTQEIYLKLRVTENATDIENEAKGQVGKAVYFNGTKDSVTLVSVNQENGNEYLIIKGNGEIEDSRYILNGESVAAGQKAEIHSNFQAKTVITDVQNEPFKGN